MKICKINGVRAAALGLGKNGILYNTEKIMPISEVVKDRIANANSLYNVFCLKPKISAGISSGAKKPPSDRDAILEKMAIINAAAKNLLENKIKDNEFLSSMVCGNGRKVATVLPKSFIKTVVAKKLRRGLNSQQEFFVDLIDCLMNNPTVIGIKFFPANHDMDSYFKALRFDYGRKTNCINSIVNSIEKQKTNIIIKDDEFCFGSDENEDKKMMSDFLEKYAKDAAELTSIFQLIEHEYFGVDISKDEEKKALFILGDEKADIPELFRQKLNEIYAAKIKNETNNKKHFWFSLVHKYLVNEFVKKLYADKKQKRWKQATAYTYEYVIHRCHGMIKNYITSKYLQLGKAVYHFYDFQNKKLNLNSVDSFDYELIKAKDTLCQKIHTSVVFACNAFLCSMPNYKGDVGNNTITGLNDEDKRLLLRFFGGQSSIEPKLTIEVNALASEINQALYSVRNNHFHYSDENSKVKAKNYPTLRQLFNVEIANQGQYLVEKYQSNNVYMFYSESFVDALLKKLYEKQNETKPYIPSFKSVLPLSKFDSNKIGKVEQSCDIYKATSYFLLKEIYYNAFIGSAGVGKYFTEALQNRMANPIKEDNPKAWEDFNNLIMQCGDNFDAICECCIRGYADKNSKPETSQAHGETHKGDSLKMFLDEITRASFYKFAEDNFKGLYHPAYNENYKDVKPVIPRINITLTASDETLEWYALARFIDSRELNMLRGDFAKYAQYLTDIMKRGEVLKKSYAKDMSFYNQMTRHFENYGEIIKLLDLCQISSGRVTNTISDYYESEEEYAKELGCYLQYDNQSTPASAYGQLKSFCLHNDGKTNKQQIYMDEQHPIVFATIEKARMCGADELLHSVVTKITKQNFDNYVKLKESENIYHLSMLSTLDNRIDIVNKNRYNQIENRIKLHDVSRLSSLLFDLYSQLISYCYKWERDYGYFLMGFMYLRDKSELPNIKKIFVYGENIKNITGGNAIHVGGKLHPYIAVKKDALQPQFNTLMHIDKPKNGNEKSGHVDVRNSIDHFDLFKGKGNSLFEYYNFMTVMLGYDRKTQNDVMVRFKNILERYFMICSFKYISPKSNFEKIEIDKDLESKVFIYKVNKKDKRTWVKVSANSQILRKEVKKLIFYKPKRKI